ncbi:MAG: riboflavin synthase [Actinobacteria bacterium]|nr:riboflavin synthase [Actinomycetota bacterium]
MFTGIVQAVGVVDLRSEASLVVKCDIGDLQLGESIAVNGVCLTVSAFDSGTFGADVSEETDRLTGLGALGAGDPVNLERAMSASDRFGGHIVQGHVDGTGKVVDRRDLAGSTEITFTLPAELERYLVPKGSITLDGVSLTVTQLHTGSFGVSLVPHTLQSTTFGHRRAGDVVNIEVDVLAKYVERLLASVPTDQLRR